MCKVLYGSRESIISNEKKCYFCGNANVLHKHHIFFGPNRKMSDKYGCWVYLCPHHHNMSSISVHKNREADLILKRECQIKFELLHGHKLFMEKFGKNYI